MKMHLLLSLLVGAASCIGEPELATDEHALDRPPFDWQWLFQPDISVTLEPTAPSTLHPLVARFTVTNYSAAPSDGRVIASFDGNAMGQAQNAGRQVIAAGASISGSFATYYPPAAGSHTVKLTYQVYAGQIIVPTPWGGIKVVDRYDDVDTFEQTITVTAKAGARIVDNGLALLRGNDLGDLPRWCAGDVELTYQGNPAHVSELHLFGREPEAFGARMAALTDAQISAGAWSSAVAQPNPSPSIVAIPYPPNAQAPLAPITLALATQNFFAAGVPVDAETACNPAASPSAQIHQGAVKAAAVYRRGLCSTNADLQDIQAQVAQGFWKAFVDNGDTSNEQQRYTKAITVLERAVAGDPSSIRAGFLLAFRYGATIYGSWNEFWGRYRYRFGLEGGVLKVVNTEGLAIDHSGPISDFAWGSIYQGLQNDIPTRVNENILARQLVDLGPLSSACNEVSECTAGIKGLADQVTATSLAAAGLPNPTATDVQQVRCTLGSAVDCAAVGRAVDASRWQCPRFSDPSQAQVCRYFLPIERMNPMADSLELVFFDRVSVTNPAFALAAAVGKGRVCSAAPAQVASPPGRYYRGFANVGIGP